MEIIFNLIGFLFWTAIGSALIMNLASLLDEEIKQPNPKQEIDQIGNNACNKAEHLSIAFLNNIRELLNGQRR